MSDYSEQISALSPKKQELFHLLMEKKRKASIAPVVQPITRSAHAGQLPLSFAQQRLWFLEQWQPGASVYSLTGGSRLVGRLNVQALEAALNEIWRRHEVLRTCFRTIDGQPVQFLLPADSLVLRRLELDGSSETELEQQLQQVIQGE